MHHSEAHAGSAAAKREKQKVNKYHTPCASAGWSFVPVVAETSGAWGTHAGRFFTRLARRLAMCSGAPLKTVFASLWASLSTVLARSVAGMLISSLPQRSVINTLCAENLPHSASGARSPVSPPRTPQRREKHNAVVMYLPSGEVHPLRPPAICDMGQSTIHIATNAELGLHDPTSEVMLLDCERYIHPTHGHLSTAPSSPSSQLALGGLLPT